MGISDLFVEHIERCEHCIDLQEKIDSLCAGESSDMLVEEQVAHFHKGITDCGNDLKEKIK